MENFLKRKIGGENLPSEKPPIRPVRPIAIRPFPKGASAFQPWHPSWEKSLGFAGSSNSSAPNPNLQIHNSNGSVEQHHNNISNVVNSTNSMSNVVNSTPDYAVKNLNNGVGGAIAAEAQLMQAHMSGHSRQEMDVKRLRRMISNRASAQRCRIRKEAHVATLERKVKAWENEITFLCQQIETHKDQNQSMLLEQHKLKLQIASREREKILQEVEIEKNSLEVMRLNERPMEQVVEAQTRMLNNMGATVQLMYNPNLNPSGFGHFICSDSNQAQNGVGTSRMQTGIGQQPQNQSHVWMANQGPQNQSQVWMANRGQQNQSQVRMANWGNGQRSTPNWSIVKSEPEDY